MLKNYFLTAIRSASKNVFHVITNVIGLGIGIAMCIVAFLLNAYNSEFNDMYEPKDTKNIYRVDYSNIENERQVLYFGVDDTHTHFLNTDIAGIESVMKFYGKRVTVKTGDDRYGDWINFCNEDFIKTFPFELTEGTYTNFNEPDAAYINEDLAEKYFKDESAIGKTIDLLVKDSDGGVHRFTVRGVFKNNQPNSSFSYVELLTNYENLYRIEAVDRYDPRDNTITGAAFIKVSDQSVLESPELKKRLQEYANMKNTEGESYYRFTPFSRIHKHVDQPVRIGFTKTEISAEDVLTFDLLGLMILLIACFNYTIYAISVSGTRLKEIGLRKVLGSTRRQIQIQFMAESLLMGFAALFMGFIIAQFLYPAFSETWGGFDYGLWDMKLSRLIIFLICLTLFMSFVAGFYPALYVSKFNPSAILARNTKLKMGGWITHGLVFFQQAITIVGLGASIIFTENIYWQEDMDYGYDKDNLLTVQALNAMKNDTAFIELVRQHPKITSTGLSWKMLGNGTGDRPIVMNEKEYYVDLMETGPNYMETNGVRLKSGRFWRNNSVVDMEMHALVNERFLEITELSNPIGAQIELPNGHKVTVIGVIENYKQAGPWEESQPTVVHYPLDKQFKFLAIRGNSMEDLKEIDEYCKEQWNKVEPFMPYVSMYETGNIEGAMNVGNSFKQTFLFTAIIALFLSIGGIYSLITMLVQNRTKEIAIRKALGSGANNILVMISKPYIIITLIAGLFGGGLGVWIVSMLLDDIYDYHVEVRPGWYILCALIMLMVTILTISSKTLKAARANPVKGLRYE